MPRPTNSRPDEPAVDVVTCARCPNPLPEGEGGWNRFRICPSCRQLALQDIALSDLDPLPEVD